MPEYRVWRRMSGDHCARCQRAAPDVNSHEFMRWEALNEEGDIICPDCLAGAEVKSIMEDDEATAAEARQQAEWEGGDA
jgi:hypothetical protein